MESISLSASSSIAQWTLFLGIALLILGIIEKRENYSLAGQIVFLTLGGFGLWVLFTQNIPLPDENTISLSKEIKVMTFFKGSVILMVISALTLIQKLYRLPYQKAGIYILIFIAILLFFMLFNIIKIPNTPPSV